MNLGEARSWLDAHGGRWCVRATQTTCFLLATMGALTVRARVRTLGTHDVDAALVAAVTELQEREGGPTPP
jgi:hypothetical protein